MKWNRALAYLPLLLIGACSPSKPETTTGHSLPQVDPARASALFTAFNAHQWQTMAELYAEDAMFLDPSLGAHPVKQSRAEIVAKYMELQAMCPDVLDSLVSVLPCDTNKLVVEFVSKGTLPDGTHMRLPIVSILTYRNGLIVSDHTYYDNN
jgi:hypothetical protein